MARNHARDGNFSEAACCQLHIAALMAEYLKLRKIHPWGAEAFDQISVNISKDERNLKLDAGIQDIHYNESLLLEQLEICADTLEKAGASNGLGIALYRLIVPIYEKKRNYEALANCYSHLAQACNKIVEVTRTGKRLLGRFYRVAFFGMAYFEEENGQEYIYKEPKVTSLSEISERLLHLYSEKFGSENVKIIMDSVPVDVSELDPKIAYIQVTPYLRRRSWKCDKPSSSRITTYPASCLRRHLLRRARQEAVRRINGNVELFSQRNMLFRICEEAHWDFRETDSGAQPYRGRFG
ncbi:dedicator of cytokinesis protein 11-like isoform X2 [Temnothorax nylanderi]|uniref:dedicator of cytokinesis protein 11-like isoform X2 n=1 Tax=Temnothorax nylanderi TaxID=102681 RepID=UPI003A8C663A